MQTLPIITVMTLPYYYLFLTFKNGHIYMILNDL